VHVRHIQIENDELHSRHRELFDSFEAGCCFEEFGIVECLQRCPYHLANRRRVIDYQNFVH